MHLSFLLLTGTQPFEIMCDASDLAIGAVLGQRMDHQQHVIYYSSRTLRHSAKLHYDGEGILGHSIRVGKVPSIHARIENHSL